jgi:hypothetical protein
MERFGYPTFLTATADALIEAQDADRTQLPPIRDRIVAASSEVGEATMQARKSYISPPHRPALAR